MNIEEMVQQIATGNREEGIAALRDHLSKQSTDAEKGMVYVMFAEAYMKTMTDLNNQQADYMNALEDLLQELDKKEQKFDDLTKLQQARSALE